MLGDNFLLFYVASLIFFVFKVQLTLQKSFNSFLEL